MVLTALRQAAGEALGRAHFVDAEAGKDFYKLMDRLAGEDGDEDAGGANE
jgi:hypothetical protein